MQLFINNWSTSLTAAATAEAASLSVSPVEAAKLVGLGTGDYYLLTLFEVDSLTGEELRREIVRATAVSGGNITVVRDQEDSGAQVWDAGQLIEARLTKETMETLRDATALSNDDPAALGPVSPGVSSEASRSDHVHPLPTPADIGAATAAQGAAADAAIPLAQKGAASGVAPLDAGAKVALIHLPATAITSTFVVNTEAAMLALSAQEGDVAIRPDISTSFILQAEPASTLANWQELLSPGSGGGAPVGSATPQPLGTASPGVSTSASRQDHVHEMPDAADVGADPAGAAAAAQAHAVQRGNHTGTQAISTVTGLPAALDAKATNPMTAPGDLIVGGASGAPARLPLGGPLQMPRVNAAGTGIEYADPPAGAGLPVVRAITANETLGLAQINTWGLNSTTNNYTSTIPAQADVAWSDDAEMHFLPDNTGDITLTAAAGVSLNGVVAGSVTLSTQHGAASMKRKGLNSWWVGGAFTGNIEASSLNGGQLGGLRNKIINGNPLVNQRAVSGTVVLAAGAYGHDRWKAGASGCTYTFTTSNNVTTLTISAGSLQQVVEGNNLQSGSYTLSWGGTAQGKIGAGSYSASGVTGSITGGTNTTVEFNTGTLSLVQLEFGSTPSSFERRFYAEELRLCQRYYWRLNAYGLGIANVAGDGFGVKYPATMRASPTLSNASFAVGVGSSGTPTLLYPTADGAVFYNSAVNWTVGAGVNVTGDLSAEL